MALIYLLIFLYFKTIGHEQWFYYYLTGIIATAALASCTPEPSSSPTPSGTSAAPNVLFSRGVRTDFGAPVDARTPLAP